MESITIDVTCLQKTERFMYSSPSQKKVYQLVLAPKGSSGKLHKGEDIVLETTEKETIDFFELGQIYQINIKPKAFDIKTFGDGSE